MAYPEFFSTGVPDPVERNSVVLVVEDEVLIRLVLSDYLQECGFKVYEAANAEEAMEILGSDHEVDIVFSDVNLSGSMNGFALTKWIRETHPGLSVILTSGDAKLAAAAKELCQSEPFLAKPYDVEAVVRQIRAQLAKRAEA